MTIGEHMVAAREKHGLTRPQLARKAGLSSEIIGKYERDEHFPGLVNLLSLSDVLGISIDEYVGHKVGGKK